MLIDALASFLSPGSAAVPILGASLQIGSTFDAMGSGAGTAPPNIIGNVTLFGTDFGPGMYKPEIAINLGSANFAGGTSVNFQFQGAPDLGTPTYQPGTFVTYSETGAIPTATLLANLRVRMDWPVNLPISLRPRYFRIYATVVGTFTAGSVTSAIITIARDDPAFKYAANNYVVA